MAYVEFSKTFLINNEYVMTVLNKKREVATYLISKTWLINNFNRFGIQRIYCFIIGEKDDYECSYCL